MLCESCGIKAIREKSIAPLKYKNGTQVRRGDHFEIAYEGIVVDLFAEKGQTWVLVYWIPIQPDKGATIKTNHVFSEREWAKIAEDAGSPSDKIVEESLQRLDAAQFTEQATRK